MLRVLIWTLTPSGMSRVSFECMYFILAVVVGYLRRSIVNRKLFWLRSLIFEQPARFNARNNLDPTMPKIDRGQQFGILENKSCQMHDLIIVH
jgi:hypothetical protein